MLAARIMVVRAMGIMITMAAGIITMILMPSGVALPRAYALSYSYGCI